MEDFDLQGMPGDLFEEHLQKKIARYRGYYDIGTICASSEEIMQQVIDEWLDHRDRIASPDIGAP